MECMDQVYFLFTLVTGPRRSFSLEAGSYLRLIDSCITQVYMSKLHTDVDYRGCDSPGPAYLSGPNP